MTDARLAEPALPRGGWQRAADAAWRIALWIVVTGVATIVAGTLLAPLQRGWANAAVPYLAGCLGALAGTGAMLYLVERRSWDAVWLGREAWRPRALLAGAALGAAAIAVPVAALLVLRWMAVEPTLDASWWGAAGRMLVVLVPAALAEELVARGYPFQKLRAAAGGGWALLLTSAAFALLHLQNSGVSARAILVVFLAGLFLGGVLLATRSLAAATLAHLAWNATLAIGLHAVLSGSVLETPDYRLVEQGPDWATGGAWGPEGGAGAVLGLGGALGYLIVRRRRRGER